MLRLAVLCVLRRVCVHGAYEPLRMNLRTLPCFYTPGAELFPDKKPNYLQIFVDRCGPIL
jgi:hypothetical protein